MAPGRAAAFDGKGSMGNGGAMRAGPLGACFADDLAAAATQARRSAEVTHAHPEGQAGAMAVAEAAARATREDRVERLFEAVLAHTPDGGTRARIALAARMPFVSDVRTAVSALGNGSQVIAEDTVPLCLWCAARHLHDYEAALWTTVSALGDRDTTFAIVAASWPWSRARASRQPGWPRATRWRTWPGTDRTRRCGPARAQSGLISRFG